MTDPTLHRLTKSANERDAMRKALFEPLNDLVRFKRLVTSDVFHAPDCRNRSVVFEQDDDYGGPLSVSQAEHYREIRERLERMATPLNVPILRVKRHVAKCPNCKAIRVRLSALVMITAGDLILSREYAL